VSQHQVAESIKNYQSYDFFLFSF